MAVKPHVLRYWEQEFPSLSPVKRRGNRRYYQRQDVVSFARSAPYCTKQALPLVAHVSVSKVTAKQEQTPYKQLLDQTIVELEDVLASLSKDD